MTPTAAPSAAHRCPRPPAQRRSRGPAQPLYDTPDRDEDAAVTAMSQSATGSRADPLWPSRWSGWFCRWCGASAAPATPPGRRLARAYLIRTAVVAVAFAVFLLVGALVLGAVLHAGLTYYYANPYFW